MEAHSAAVDALRGVVEAYPSALEALEVIQMQYRLIRELWMLILEL